MDSSDIRKKYIEFFIGKGHKQIDPSPLVLEDDPTTLFTSAGMQQLVPYLKGEKTHKKGKRLVNSQLSVRAQGKNDDMFEVGDDRHLTTFEMLGNWSLGDYFKKEQLSWVWEFFTEELKLPKEKLWVTVFEGTKEVPKDEKSYQIWKEIGVPEEKIKYCGVKENWWSVSGVPSQMPEGEIGGPSSEVFFEFDSVKHNPTFEKKCHPNCGCGKFLEIGNSVFIQYKKKSGKLTQLDQKNVDFGGGLERITAATLGNPDIFQIDIYKPIITKIEKIIGDTYSNNKKEIQIVADHVRSSKLLVDEGIIPSNKLQGHVLRRLIRRSIIKLKRLKSNFSESDFREIVDNPIVLEEFRKFQKTINSGLRQIEKIENITGKKAFDLYQSYGIPIELTIEIFKDKGQKVNKNDFRKEFDKHRKLSQTKSSGMFKGGLGDDSRETVKLHTATHLLHFALRKVLGDSVRQEGSNITSERLRFDFSHNEKLSDEEVKKVEKLINEKIKEDLPVKRTIEDKNEALESGALAFFGEKYPDEVVVYSIGTNSREFCGGPHVGKTSDIGRVSIERQKKIGSNMIRVYAVVEK